MLLCGKIGMFFLQVCENIVNRGAEIKPSYLGRVVNELQNNKITIVSLCVLY